MKVSNIRKKKNDDNLATIIKKIRQAKYSISNKTVQEQSFGYTGQDSRNQTINHKHKSNMSKFQESPDYKEIRGYKLDAAALIGDRLLKLLKNVYMRIYNHDREKKIKESYIEKQKATQKFIPLQSKFNDENEDKNSDADNRFESKTFDAISEEKFKPTQSCAKQNSKIYFECIDESPIKPFEVGKKPIQTTKFSAYNKIAKADKKNAARYQTDESPNIYDTSPIKETLVSNGNICPKSFLSRASEIPKQKIVMPSVNGMPHGNKRFPVEIPPQIEKSSSESSSSPPISPQFNTDLNANPHLKIAMKKIDNKDEYFTLTQHSEYSNNSKTPRTMNDDEKKVIMSELSYHKVDVNTNEKQNSIQEEKSIESIHQGYDTAISSTNLISITKAIVYRNMGGAISVIRQCNKSYHNWQIQERRAFIIKRVTSIVNMWAHTHIKQTLTHLKWQTEIRYLSTLKLVSSCQNIGTLNQKKEVLDTLKGYIAHSKHKKGQILNNIIKKANNKEQIHSECSIVSLFWKWRISCTLHEDSSEDEDTIIAIPNKAHIKYNSNVNHNNEAIIPISHKEETKPNFILRANIVSDEIKINIDDSESRANKKRQSKQLLFPQVDAPLSICIDNKMLKPCEISPTILSPSN